jgi:anti-anti-sigma regulatory factor
MLKITSVVSAEHETTLQLDGSVAGEWIELLRSLAESELGKGTRLTLDLKNVSFIDCVGIALLKRLIRSGVNTVNPPLFVVEQIRKCNDAQGQ